jgi:hypothetical protein
VPATTSEAVTTSGSTLSGQMRVRHFTQEGWGADWFFEFDSTNLGAQGLTQSENVFRAGVTILFELD